jgi:hypothetical protein
MFLHPALPLHIKWHPSPLVTTYSFDFGGLLLVAFCTPGASEACVISMNLISIWPSIVVIVSDMVSAYITSGIMTDFV